MSDQPPPRPLNGAKTHPLTAVSLGVLERLGRKGPKPTSEINPGICNRLLREALVEVVDLPSPFKTHKGRSIPHLKITEAGKGVLA